MKSFNNLEKWAEKKDRKIALSHEKKDLKALKASLEKLNGEQIAIIKEIHYVEYLLDLCIHPDTGQVKTEPEQFDDYRKFRGWMKELKKELKKLGQKPKADLSPQENEFLIRETTRLTGEKKRLEKHLKVTDELIAKNTILLIDIEETLCRELSKGRSISSVTESVKEEFGDKLEKGYTNGKRDISNFLEKHFNISRHSALELIKLLIDRKVLNYCIKIPREKYAENIYFHTPYIDDFMDDSVIENDDSNILIEPLFGSWVINA